METHKTGEQRFSFASTKGNYPVQLRLTRLEIPKKCQANTKKILEKIWSFLSAAFSFFFIFFFVLFFFLSWNRWNLMRQVFSRRFSIESAEIRCSEFAILNWTWRPSRVAKAPTADGQLPSSLKSRRPPFRMGPEKSYFHTRLDR